ncbi:MAG: apolipoprotein N-acyltransferase, partial [Terrimicrobiaceae bacterium]
ANAAALTEELLHGTPPADLVVWFEIPRNIDCDGPEPAQLGFVAHARAVKAPLLFNCVDFSAGAQDGERSTVRNTVLMLDGQGRPANRYHKQILFPFCEYIPFEREAPWLRRLAPAVSIYRPGREAKVFDLGRGRGVIPLLCYEAMFGDPIRRGIAKGGNVLINLTDDAWFGNSDASEFHLAFQPFRVVEYRTPLVRANNAGISAFIAATGEIIPGTKTGLFQRMALRRELFIPSERTFYYRFGDLFLYGLIVLCGVDLARRRLWTDRDGQDDYS